MDLAQRLDRLERTVRRQRLGMVLLTTIIGGMLVATYASPTPATLTARAIRIVDAAGRPRILIGAPPPAAGRERQDGQTATLLVLGPDGRDRLILGEAPEPRLDGKTYHRIAASYGLVLHDAHGSERGGIAYLDNGRAVVALDRPGGDAVGLIANEATGFAGLTINYATPLGQGQEGVRIGTQGDTAWLSLLDRREAERARLAVDGRAPPQLIVHAGEPRAHP